MDQQAFMSFTIARNENNNDLGGARRRFNVPAEMASASRPKNMCKKSTKKSREPLNIDVELAFAPGPLYRFCVRFMPIFLGLFCAVMAVCTCYIDYNARWSYSTQTRYASFARAHDETFRPSQLPTIFKIVDTVVEYRNMREMNNHGVINMNSTPQDTGFLARQPEPKALDLLAIGSARVAAEAVRSDDARPWNLYVPRTIGELQSYTGDSFCDAIVLAGDEQAYFPVSKAYSFLHKGGIVVHQIPPHIDGRPIYASYQKVFGRSHTRSEFIHAGSRIIVATKEDNSALPAMPLMQEAYHSDNLVVDYHYLVM